jgi:hypothetical protein
MRDCAEMFNESGEHIATVGFNESYGLWQIVIVQRKEMEFFCPSKEVAFAAWHDEFDPKLDSRNRLHALASMLDLSVSSRNGVLCNFWIPDESNFRVMISHVANL